MAVFIGCLIFFVAGGVAMLSAVHNSSKNSADETARVFTAGLIVAVLSAAVAYFTLLD